MIVRDVSSAPARSQTVARDMSYQGATSLAATRSKTSREDPNNARSVEKHRLTLYQTTQPTNPPTHCDTLTHQPTDPTTDGRSRSRSPFCHAVERPRSLRSSLPR